MQSVSGTDLFRDKWLVDPNCVGSSVAALGQESPSLQTSDSWPSASGDGGDVPRTTPESVYMPNEYLYHPQDNTITQDRYHVNARDITGADRVSQNFDAGRTDSEAYLAAQLLYQIHKADT